MDSRSSQIDGVLRSGRSTARRYGYSVSLEDGVQAAVTMERVVSGTDRLRATSVSFDVRRYTRGLTRHHVAAVRLAGGAMSEEGNPGEWFFLGGAGPAGAVGPLERRPFGLLRGFAVDGFAGTRLAVANVEYRWPLAWPERGIGTWPAFLRSLQVAAFADVGHAWTGRFRPADTKWSVGGELGTSVVFGYGLPLTVTVGAGFGRDGQRESLPASRTAYLRLGSAF